MLPKKIPNVCRLCLVREHVDINIFEDNTEQLFQKITSCLPVSITVEDELPKSICYGCCGKVNLFYEYWNQTLSAEKYLLSWLKDESKSDFSKENVNQKSSGHSDKNERNRNLDCTSNGQKNENFSNTNSPDFWSSGKDDSNDCDYNLTYHDDDDDYDDNDGAVNDEANRTAENSNPSALKRLQGYTEELSNNSFGNLSRIFQVLNSPGEMVDTTASLDGSTTDAATHGQNDDESQTSASSATSSSSYRCDGCCKTFSCTDILAMHKLSQCSGSGGDVLQPPRCHRTFDADSPAWTQHSDTACHVADGVASSGGGSSSVAGGGGFRCDICAFTFATKHQLAAHGATHNDTKPFVCPKCGTAFRYRKTYETHCKIHENERTSDEQQFVCDVCEQRFTTRNSYIHHARSHKNAAAKSTPKLMCVVCNRTFAAKRLLTHHLRTQCGERRLACETCGKELYTREALESHRLVHAVAAKAPLVCQVCHKTFAQRKYFVVHQRIHTGERPYKCSTCGKTFTQASALTVHRRYHTGERPYKCHVCAKGFVTRTVMLSHLKYHKDS